jgi:Yip1 domain
MMADASEPAPAPNPWRTIWFSPRRTIRQLIAEPTSGWRSLFLLGLATSLLSTLNGWLALDTPAMDLVRSSTLIVVIEILAMWPGARLMRRYGRWRGGRGVTAQIKVAMAYSYIPMIAGALFWIPLWIATGGVGFQWQDGPQPILPSMLYFATELGGYWAGIVSLITLAEVHRFSVWRALETILVFSLVLIMVYLFLAAVWRRPNDRPVGHAALITIPCPFNCASTHCCAFAGSSHASVAVESAASM